LPGCNFIWWPCFWVSAWLAGINGCGLALLLVPAWLSGLLYCGLITFMSWGLTAGFTGHCLVAAYGAAVASLHLCV
jgi:hypothetical protein